MNASPNSESRPSPSRLVVGLLTIGQSPRPDIVDDLRRLLGLAADNAGPGFVANPKFGSEIGSSTEPFTTPSAPKLEVLESGALDGLSPADLDSLRPDPREPVLLTRLADATPVVVGKRKLVPLLNERIAALETRGVSLVALLCTDAFTGLRHRLPLLLPSNLLTVAAAALPFPLPVGVVVPLAAQRNAMRRRWQRATDRDVVVQIADPYAATPDWDAVARRFARDRFGVIVLDCFGYTSDDERRLRKATRSPVLAPRSLLARTILSIAADPQ